MGDYHDLETDVILLVNVFESFRKVCLDNYGLDPAHFYTNPGLAWKACLKKTGINRKNDLILIITPEKQDKTLELSKHWSVGSTPARNEVIMKRTYPVKSVKCDKICSNY